MKTLGSIIAPYLTLLAWFCWESRNVGGPGIGDAMGILIAVLLMSFPVMFLARYAVRGGMRANGWAEWSLRLALWMTVSIHLGLAALEDGLGVDTSCFREIYDGNPPILRTLMEGICFGGLAGIASNVGAMIGAKYDIRISRRAPASSASGRG